MSNEDNDNIEGFFRKATSRYDNSFNENDWRELEKMLDEEAEKTAALNAKRRTIATMVVAGIGLLMLIGGLLINSVRDTPVGQSPVAGGPEQQESLSQGGINKIADEKNVTPEEDTKQLPGDEKLEVQDQDDTKKLQPSGIRANSERDKYSTTTDRTTLPPNNRNSGAGKSGLTPAKRGIPESTNIAGKNRLADKNNKQQNDLNGMTIPDINAHPSHEAGPEDTAKQKNITRSDETDLLSDNAAGKEKQVDSSVGPADSASDSQLPPSESIAEQKKAHQPVSISAKDALAQAEDSTAVETIPVSKALEKDEAVEDDKENEEPSRWPSSRWSVSFVAAPDFSRTTSGSYANPGDAFGLLVNYKFLKRWSLSTGALRSSKNYRSSGNEYTPPKGYWIRKTNGVIPEKIDGNCVVLEIPLSLAFDFIETKRSRMFASAGVSSYLMLNQQYDYIFEDPNPGAATRWHSDEHESYSFSIGTLSLGYEYLVRPSLSIGVEPYYKIPFGGVGWGNVNLYSAGVYFVGRYRFLR